MNIIHLNSIPIKDFWHEKEMLEAGEFARKLNSDYPLFVVARDEDSNQKRIVEVYRLCFEAAEAAARLQVIRDFAAHFPDLLLGAWWIQDLIKRESVELGFSKKQLDILGEINTGLRSVLRKQPRKSAVHKYYDVAAAKALKDTIFSEFKKWDKGLERSLNPEESYIADESKKKADELTKKYKLPKHQRSRLERLLSGGKCYDAAVLIASKLLNVPERKIESEIE